MFQKLLPYTLRSGPEWFLSVITDLSNCYQGSEGKLTELYGLPRPFINHGQSAGFGNKYSKQ